jgi:NIMA (never in mitosis gene a)-related kinase
MEKYQIKEVIGHGAFGFVQKAIRVIDGQVVSIKMIEITQGNENLTKQEVTALMQLDHPNVVKHFENFNHHKYFCIVMEFCEGKTLREFIDEQKNPLEESYILNLFFQMVNVLKYCHDQNVMHRDLKPENIILTPNDQIKLIDFGVARIFDQDANLASTYAGTPFYMSPELLTQGKKYSFASDNWSLGIIVYELMTFKRPFEGTTLDELKSKILYEDPPAITFKYSGDLINVVKHLLSKEPFTRISLRKLIKHPSLWVEKNQNQKIERLEQELVDQKEINQKQQVEIQQLKKENQHQENQYKRLKKTNQQMKKETQILSQSVKQKEKEIEQKEKEIEQKDKEIEQKDKEIEQLKKEKDKLMKQVTPPKIQKNENSRGSLSHAIRVNLSESSAIISFLRKIDEDSILVTVSSIYDEESKPENVLNTDQSFWWSENEENSWIQFEFKSHFISPQGYLIRNGLLYSPKGWKLEGSKDENEWVQLHEITNSEIFKQGNQEGNFHCKTDQFFSFLRLTQIQGNFGGNVVFLLNFVEFYGKVVKKN